MPNRTVNHNNRNRAAYQVAGNTVRRMEAMPDYRKERRDRQEREREEELRKRRRAAARNQEKALQMNLFSVLLLTVAVICTLGAAAIYMVITVPTVTMAPSSSLAETTQPVA